MATLDALLAAHRVVAAVTQPDRPAGRGQRVAISPVKRRAEEAGVPVLQPARVRDAEWPARLSELGADVAVVAAYGQILPQAVLDAPARGSINVHASLLPRYRGAAPIAWSIIRGETETGITTFQMDAGMDTRGMQFREATPLGAGETAGELTARLADLGARVLVRTLALLDALTPTPQDHAAATLAPRLKKEDGRLRFADRAADLVNRVRGVNPWPGASVTTPLGRLLVWRAVAEPHVAATASGTLVATESGAVGIATADGALVPQLVQPESKKAMTWDDFLRGARLAPGARVDDGAP